MTAPVRASRRRRRRPSYAAVIGARRAAASTLAVAETLAAELRGMLGGDVAQRGLALTAVLPGAAVRRGDGELLAALGDAFADRAAAYVVAVS